MITFFFYLCFTKWANFLGKVIQLHVHQRETQTFLFYLYKKWFRTSNGDLFTACLTADHMHLKLPHLSNYFDYNLILINIQNDGPNDDMLQ